MTPRSKALPPVLLPSSKVPSHASPMQATAQSTCEVAQCRLTSFCIQTVVLPISSGEEPGNKREDDRNVSEPRCHCSSIRLSCFPHSRAGTCSSEVIVNSCRGQLQRTHPPQRGRASGGYPSSSSPALQRRICLFSPGPCCIRICTVHRLPLSSRPTQPTHLVQVPKVRAPMSSSRPNGKKWTAGA